ncbi:MAG TPA: hypothetical protein DEH78_03685, partial [Solibacterales bacterium]|nr:hypothetical protein [Bryobacterales bacterium]
GLPLAAQAPRAVEVFGLVGASRIGGDESSLGTAAAFGGAVMVPITGAWAVDLEVSTGRATQESPIPTESFSARRTYVSPAVVRRWGGERLYGFGGGGVGLAVDRTRTTFQSRDFVANDSGMTLLGKFGVVAAPSERLLLRFEAGLTWRYVLPDISARVGIGYRF